MKILVTSDLETNLNGIVEGGGENTYFFTKENIEKIESMFDEVVWNKTGRMLTNEEMVEMAKDCDAILTCWGTPPITTEVLDAAPNLKIIGHMAGSVAGLVNEEVYNRGIMVVGANDREFSESVAEGALAYALTKLRRIDETVINIKKYREKGHRIFFESDGILDKTVGIVSFGAIAEHFAKMLQPFRCKIKVYSRTISEEKLKKYNMEKVSLEELFSTCDVISVHTAWNKYTEKMVSKELIKMMKDGALIINTARGAVIDEEALIKELETGRISAALDVFYPNEPPLPDSPLYDLPNVLMMDHRGGPTTDRYRFITSNMLDDVYSYLTNGTISPEIIIPKEKALSMTGTGRH